MCWTHIVYLRARPEAGRESQPLGSLALHRLRLHIGHAVGVGVVDAIRCPTPLVVRIGLLLGWILVLGARLARFAQAQQTVRDQHQPYPR